MVCIFVYTTSCIPVSLLTYNGGLESLHVDLMAQSPPAPHNLGCQPPTDEPNQLVPLP